MQGRSGDGVDHATAIGYLSEALEALGEHARQYKVPLIYEPLNRYETNMATTIEAGVQILKRLSTKNVVLLADLFHMNIEETNLPAAIRAGRGTSATSTSSIPIAVPPGWGISITRRSRRPSTTSATRALRPPRRLPYPDPDAAARQTIETFRRFFRA